MPSISSHIYKLVLPIHLIAGLGLYFHWHPAMLWLSLVGWMMISGYGIAVGFHRYLSHKSFKTSGLLHKILLYLGCLGCQGTPLFWVALHRGVHHRFSDTPRDLHSPVHGLWSAYFGWQMSIGPQSVTMRHASELLRDRWAVWLHEHYYFVIWMTLIFVNLLSPAVTLYLFVLPMVLAIHQENLVNLVAHLPWCGYRNFATADNSVNVPILGWLTWGQAWHNNHHAHPSRADFGVRWWEFDPCRPLVALIRKR